MARRGDDLTIPSFRDPTGVDPRVAERELADLLERGLLKRASDSGRTTYRLAIRTRRDRRMEFLELLRQRGALSREEIAASLGLTRTNASWWVRVPKREHLIEPTVSGRSPKVRYRLRAKRCR
jgi:DNA-binding transcriptional ArsR family regulator